jgi:hypothetical protein
MIQHSFDYNFVRPSGEKLTLRLYRGRASPAISEEAYERIARMLLAFHLSALRDEKLTTEIDSSWRVSVRWVENDDAPYDIDSLNITEKAGRARLEACAQQVKDPLLRDWLLQEADLTDVP